jgi:hypothetical protein
MAEQHQYRVVEVKGEKKGGSTPTSVTPQQLEVELSKQSKEGWELVSLHERTSDRIETVESKPGHSIQTRTTFVLSVVLIFKKGQLYSVSSSAPIVSPFSEQKSQSLEGSQAQ